MYSKLNGILKDSLILVKILEKTKFNFDPVLDAIEMMKRLVFQFQNVISNAHFIIELLDIVFISSLVTFEREYFQQIFGIIIGTNLTPILANLYLAMLKKGIKKEMWT